MAKSFKKADNPALNFITEKDKNTQEVQEQQEVQKVQEPQKVSEVQEVKKNQTSKDTQGRKGQKLPRMNMGFFDDNLEYVQKMSKIKGVTLTAYINSLITEDKQKNKELLEQIEKFLN